MNKMIPGSTTIIVILAAIASCCCHSDKPSIDEMTSKPAESMRPTVGESPSNERIGPSQKLKSDLLGDETQQPEFSSSDTRKETPERVARNNDYYEHPQHMIIRPGKIKPGQYADKAKRKTKNWKLPDFLKTAIAPADSKVSWSFWEADDSESWADDDADDSQPTTESTTTTTTTTEAPAPPPPPPSKAPKGPVSIHKHYHYFKKAEAWPSPSPPMLMPMPEEMMPMPMPEEMMEEMMKGMMMPEEMPEKGKDKDKKGLPGFLVKLSAVDPVTILVAGIIPASLILAAALPSVMNKMMNSNKGDPTMMPPAMMVSTTAMGDDMGGRHYYEHLHHEPVSMGEILQAASQFGLQAIKDPRCARKKFCHFARENLLSGAPEFQRALRIASVVMRDSWLDALGVREILQSLSLGTCDEADCDDPVSVGVSPTQPTPA